MPTSFQSRNTEYRQGGLIFFFSGLFKQLYVIKDIFNPNTKLFWQKTLVKAKAISFHFTLYKKPIFSYKMKAPKGLINYTLNFTREPVSKL